MQRRKLDGCVRDRQQLPRQQATPKPLQALKCPPSNPKVTSEEATAFATAAERCDTTCSHLLCVEQLVINIEDADGHHESVLHSRRTRCTPKPYLRKAHNMSSILTIASHPGLRPDTSMCRQVLQLSAVLQEAAIHPDAFCSRHTHRSLTMTKCLPKPCAEGCSSHLQLLQGQ